MRYGYQAIGVSLIGIGFLLCSDVGAFDQSFLPINFSSVREIVQTFPDETAVIEKINTSLTILEDFFNQSNELTHIFLKERCALLCTALAVVSQQPMVVRMHATTVLMKNFDDWLNVYSTTEAGNEHPLLVTELRSLVRFMAGMSQQRAIEQLGRDGVSAQITEEELPTVDDDLQNQQQARKKKNIIYAALALGGVSLLALVYSLWGGSDSSTQNLVKPAEDSLKPLGDNGLPNNIPSSQQGVENESKQKKKVVSYTPGPRQNPTPFQGIPRSGSTTALPQPPMSPSLSRYNPFQESQYRLFDMALLNCQGYFEYRSSIERISAYSVKDLQLFHNVLALKKKLKSVYDASRKTATEDELKQRKDWLLDIFCKDEKGDVGLWMTKQPMKQTNGKYAYVAIDDLKDQATRAKEDLVDLQKELLRLAGITDREDQTKLILQFQMVDEFHMDANRFGTKLGTGEVPPSEEVLTRWAPGTLLKLKPFFEKSIIEPLFQKGDEQSRKELLTKSVAEIRKQVFGKE